ncbi:MAG: sigma 54-interacting transcriptional regulator [Spirochaetia bacterium]|nr:sigma 54-interacting transcriptional regulator [Spirochaetia bacterium]
MGTTVEVLRLAVGLPILSVITILIVWSSRKGDKRTVERAFVALLAALGSWLLAHNVSVLVTKYLYPSPIIYVFGSFAGTSLLAVCACAYFFGEYFPHGTETRSSKARVIAVFAVSAILTPMTLSRLWIDKRGEGSTVGPFFYVISGWCVLLIVALVVRLGLKYRRASNGRVRADIRWFLSAIAGSAAVILFFSFALPSSGNWSLFFLGPSSSILVVSLVVYAVLYRELLDFDSRAFRAGVRLAVAVLFSGLVILPVLVLSPPAENGVSLGLVLAISCALVLGGLYQAVVQPRLERLIAGPSAEGMILELAHQGDGPSHTMHADALLARTAATLQAAFGSVRVALSLVDHSDSVRFYSTEPSPAVASLARRLFYSRFKTDFQIPPLLLAALQKIFILESAEGEPFMSSDEKFAKRYRRLTAFANHFLCEMPRHGYTVCASLNFGPDVVGYVMLGPKADGHPLFKRDIDILGKLRHPLALLLRNSVYHNLIQAVRRSADAEIEKLTEIITRKEVQRRTAQGKTIIYRSSAMEAVFDQVKKISVHARPVHIHGETGTGKELVARMLHEMRTPDGPFVPINCAALPASLWESEVFGSMKGAFTDSKQDRVGLVGAAAGGSLFFDEIGEMPLDMQAKLLRLLQENQYYRLGSKKVEVASCRFLFASNRDLAAMSRAGTFREDLYYRISVFGITLPPLRERKEDIEPLVDYLLTSYAPEFGSTEVSVNPKVMSTLAQHTWPGNVRELENVVLRALAAAGNGPLKLEHLPPNVTASRSLAPRKRGDWDINQADVGPIDFQAKMAEYARAMILKALEATAWNKSQAAERLQIRRSSLDYRIKELGIERDK